MVLTAYRALLNLIPLQGVVCGGAADVRCIYSPETFGGVVCNGIAIDEEIEPTPPEQPETILCFRFRPGQTAYTKHLRPVVVISAMAVESKGIVYLVNMFGQAVYVCEHDLYTLTEAIAYQQGQSILYVKQREDLEETPIFPTPSMGKDKTKVEPPKATKSEILNRALEEIDNLRLIVVSPDPSVGKTQIAVPIQSVVSGAEMLQRAMQKLNVLSSTVVSPDPSSGKLQISVLPNGAKEKLLEKVLGEISRLNFTPVKPNPAIGKVQSETVPFTEENVRKRALEQIDKLSEMSGTIPSSGKSQVELEQSPVVSGKAIRERALQEIDRLEAIKETIEV
jgi:hypothetical protein